VTLFDAAPGSGPEAASAQPAAPAAQLRLLVAYDGTDFHGFAAQPGQPTVAGVLSAAVAQYLRRESIDLVCAGRTDAGVHGWGQVVSVALDARTVADLDPERLARALNRRLAPRVVIRDAATVDGTFDARRSALWRRYRYTIVNRAAPDPFRARFAWWVPAPLELSILRLAADPLVGEHDFAAFCRKGPEGSSSTRRVFDSHWETPEPGVLVYEIRANAFCWQMVRAIVGTLVEIGEGARTPGDVLRILRSRDRAQAGRLAPPHGLCLWEVSYSD
jgi:tRNA pseudouridine38-40 synthase